MIAPVHRKELRALRASKRKGPGRAAAHGDALGGIDLVVVVPDSATQERFGRFCIGCGCCDAVSCPGGCGWLRIHDSVPVGVCSECRAYWPVLSLLSLPVARAIYREKVAAAEEWE